MRSVEQNFAMVTLGADVVALLTVGFTHQPWTVVFAFAFVVSFLIVVQFFLRYLAITNWYKTESSIASWVVSLFIFPFSLAVMFSTPRPRLWFFFLGALLLLASAKTQQTRRTVLAMPSPNRETAVRLQDSMITELAVGLFMICLGLIAAIDLTPPNVSPESTVFYGSLFALFHAVVSTSKSIVSVWRNKPTISEILSEAVSGSKLEK